MAQSKTSHTKTLSENSVELIEDFRKQMLVHGSSLSKETVLELTEGLVKQVQEIEEAEAALSD